jgi:Protein of unknown function (DUF721).
MTASAPQEPPEPSGRDLARIALQQARAAAKHAPTRPAKPVRRRVARRMDGRDPMPLAAALEHLVAEHGWETPAAGGSIIDQWPAIAPELDGKVTAVGFDAERGRLTLLPCSAAYGAQLRMLERQMVARINAKTGRVVVRSLWILPPGRAGGPASAAGSAAQQTACPGSGAPPVAAADMAPRTRADASAGLRTAQDLLAGLQDRVPRAPQTAGEWVPVLREPTTAFTDAVAMTADLEAQAARREDPRERALARARAEKAGHAPAVPRAFEQSA